jgi:enamine deaminase RidA (YjgF/YER057c/UK114 family)
MRDVGSLLGGLGLELPPLPAPKGRYRPAIVDGSRLWVSGHTGRTPSSPALVGTVGTDVTLEQAQGSARLAAVNVLAAALATVAQERLAGVLLLRGYVRADGSFGDQPAVIDGASEVLDHVLGGSGHARAAIGVASLPGGACVELEAVLRLR